MKKILYFALTLTMSVGCIKQVYTAYTDHPTMSQVTLYTNALSDNPVTFLNGVRIGASLTDTLLDPDTYYFYAYVPTDDMEDYVTPSSGSDISVPIYLKSEDGFVPSDIDDIYYGFYGSNFYGDQDRIVSLAPLFASRNLTINVYLSDVDYTLISSVSATLSGLSQGWSLHDDIPVGDVVSTRPEFTVSENMLTAPVRMLGVNTDVSQVLTVDLTYQSGDTATFEIDVTEPIAKINGTLDRVINVGNWF